METFAPETCHEQWMRNNPPLMAFDPSVDYRQWREKVDEKLRELVGWMPEKIPLNIRIEYEKDEDLFHEKRFIFSTEPGADVPCHLLIPKGGKSSYPVVICLQGHSTGMHNSLGRPKYPKDAPGLWDHHRDTGIQAVKEGYAALVLEQRCFGERADQRPKDVRSFKRTCRHASLVAIMLGRTMIGERVWDVSRAIDALGEFPKIDTGRIACMGNSGGGTTTFFASCLEPRITVSMPSCYVCTFEDSIGHIDHCSCNYIPGLRRYFEMGDLACLIAPRPLVVVAGREDKIFPIEAVEKTFDTIKGVYTAAGAPEKCRLVVGEEGHQFYPQAWPVLKTLAKW